MFLSSNIKLYMRKDFFISLPKNQIRVQMAAEGVDGEVLPVQTHVGEKVELVSVVI